jgi:penicillin-binding protein 1A
MQVARNVYLSSEKTYTRKIYEVLLTFKMEHLLTKDQILEIYMNQIFLGKRAYGFAAASEAYFDKPLKNITIAEAAMLAGLPKAPSAPTTRSATRNAHARASSTSSTAWRKTASSLPQQAQAAREEEAQARDRPGRHAGPCRVRGRNRAPADVRPVRQRDLHPRPECLHHGQVKPTRTPPTRRCAAASWISSGARSTVAPKKFITLPAEGQQEMDDAIDAVLDEHPDNGDVMSAVVLEAGPKTDPAVRQNSEVLEITGDGLKAAQSGLSDKAPAQHQDPARRGDPGAKTPRAAGKSPSCRRSRAPSWRSTRAPVPSGRWWAASTSTRTSSTMSRRPGASRAPASSPSSIRPRWRRVHAVHVVNDAPLFFDAGVTGGQPWEPKNYDGKFDGPMSMRTALAQVEEHGVDPHPAGHRAAIRAEWITRFGFDEEKHLPYLTMALGAGSVTPMQMATAYSVFANGGYRVNPWDHCRVTEQSGRTLLETQPLPLDESMRAIDARNAFIMNSLLQEVTRSGTAARAQGTLKRSDLFGKTGTTNDAMDAWFAGFQPTLAAVTWIGYDTPRKMGSRPGDRRRTQPAGVDLLHGACPQGCAGGAVRAARGRRQCGRRVVLRRIRPWRRRSSLGMDDSGTGQGSKAANTRILPPSEERSRILDLFRN